MAKGYWIVRMDVRDTERYQDYIATAKPALERFGAKYIVRGGTASSMEGQGRARNVIIEFPSVEAAIDCYNAAEYQAARAIRNAVAEGDLTIVEGF